MLPCSGFRVCLLRTHPGMTVFGTARGWSGRAANEIVAGNPEITGANGGRMGEAPEMPDGIRLDGRVAVVTGAAGVIGTATMKLLAERGARIVAVDRNAALLPAAITDLPA